MVNRCNDRTVGSQIGRIQTVKDDHDINVAVFGSFVPEITALQADVEQSGAQFLPEQLGQIDNIVFNIHHGEVPPLVWK